MSKITNRAELVAWLRLHFDSSNYHRDTFTFTLVTRRDDKAIECDFSVRFSGGSTADDDGPVEAMATPHSESVTMSCVDCPTGHQQGMRLDGPNFHNLRSHAFHKHLEPQQQRSRQGSITDLLNTQARQPARNTGAAAAAAGCAEGGRNEMPPSKPQQQQHKPKPSRKRPRRGDVSDADMVVALNRERERFLAGTRHSLSAIVAPGSASALASASTATSHSHSHQTPPSLQQQQQQPFASSPIAGLGSAFQFADSRQHIISNADDDDASHSSAAAFVSGGPSGGDYSATRAVAKHVAQVAAAAAAAVRHVVVVAPASSSAPGWSISPSGRNARRRAGR
jgi:hypothetical protein